MKSVVITGSTRGIGLAMAKEFLKSDCNVTISGRGDQLDERTEKDLSTLKGKYHYVRCNVQNKSDVEYLWNRAVEQWGEVDVWINNAGQNTPYEFIYNTDSEYVDRLIDTNIKGVIYGSQVAAKHMIEQGNGQIFNMEGLGSNDMIQVRTILYGTSKRALTYFTKGLAKELKDTPVKVSRLSPGMMLTDFITKTPDGEASPIVKEKNFKFIFNTLADRPETVAGYLVPRMLKNTKNDAHIVWLTKSKILKRFALSRLNKRKLI